MIDTAAFESHSSDEFDPRAPTAPFPSIAQLLTSNRTVSNGAMSFWRFRSPEAMSRRLADAIERIWQARADAGRRYEEVVLVGFSFGSILARRAYCEARGADDSAHVDETKARRWSSAVSRIVLLAGMNRGWTVSSPVNRFREGAVRLWTALAHVLSAVREPTIFAIRRGAPFLTTTRLQWLAVRRRGVPVTVQLLGTKDDLVSPADNIDLSTGGDFFYLEVPDSGHFDVTDMSVKSLARARRRGAEARHRTIASRREQLRKALAYSVAELGKACLDTSDLVDAVPPGLTAADRGIVRPRTDVRHLVFVMHGIRDKGFWTHKVARAVKAEAPPEWNVQSWNSTYGYFALLPFLLPWTRRGKAEWFMDQYVAARALFPEAQFSFIGHSNGTYLFGSALERCRAVQFQHAVLAGSVLRSRFQWHRLVERQQIQRVRNYVATADWVVAIFPRLFELVPLQDLGSAGHDGFADEPCETVTDVEYIRGFHGAALDERRWPEIARFILHGALQAHHAVVSTAAIHPSAVATVPAEHESAARETHRQRSRTVVALGYVSPVIWLMLVALAAAPLLILLHVLGLPIAPFPQLPVWREVLASAGTLPHWAAAIAFSGWIAMLRIVLTKV